MEFIEKRAKELYRSNSGLSKAADQFGFGYPFLSYSDIFHNYYVPDHLETLVNSTDKERINCSIHRGDVFLTRTSETTDELGMSCVALRDIPDATFNGFAKRLRPITDEIVPEYAAYFFRSQYFRAQCMSMASLITRASLNDGMIERLRIRYPKNISDQEKIGLILMHYDDLIRVNNRRIVTLERMIENLYKEWFVRFRFPGHEKVEIENGIPKEWKYKKFSDVYQCIRGVSYSTEEIECEDGINLINLKNINGFGGFRTEGIKKYSGQYKNNQLVSHKDLIMGVTDMTQDRRTVGAVALLPKIHGVISADLVKIVSHISNAFSYCMFRWGYYSTYISQFGNGANVIHLKPDSIRNVKILLPNVELVTAFAEKAEMMIDEMDNLAEQNTNLIRQRDLLLPRLMSGKLEV